MVNRSFAERLFPGPIAVIGLQQRSAGAVSARIVGIVGDARELGPIATPCHGVLSATASRGATSALRSWSARPAIR